MSSRNKDREDSNASTTAPRERRACVECHRRKIRCDAHVVGFPCKNCSVLNRMDCRPHDKKKRVRRSAVDYARKPRLLLSPMPPQGFASMRPPQTNEAVARQPSQLDATAWQSNATSEHDLAPGQITTDKQLDKTQVKRHLAEFFGQDDLNNRPIGLGVRMCYVGTDASNLHFLVRQKERNKVVHHFPTFQFSRQLTTYEPNLIPHDAFLMPDKKLADDLIHAYFRHVAPGFPIIDEKLFMTQYTKRDPADPPSLLVLQAIMLVGAHVSKQQPERDSLKDMFFRRAKLLFDARHERDRLFVVQAALLLTWHSDGAEDITANCWHYIGIAARTATGLGMHCDVTPSRLVAHDKRTWRRVWWMLVQFDVLTSLSYGRPQSINLEDCDVPSLTPNDFEGCGEQTQVDYVIRFTELCILISSILRNRFSARKDPERRVQVLRRADEALAEWFSQLPSHLHLRYSNMELWPALLHLTYNKLLIILHRPQPFVIDESPAAYGVNNGEVCGEAASAVVAIAEELRESDRLKYGWISTVNSLFTAMIQVNAELRFSNPVLAVAGQRRFDSCLVSLRYLSEYWLTASTVLRLFEEKSEAVQNGSLAQQTNKSNENSEVQTGVNTAAFPQDDGEQLLQQDGHDLDWRQLFLSPSLDRDSFQFPLIDDDEWREMYWEDINLADLGSDFTFNV